MVAASDITHELNENFCFTFYVKVGEIHENENLLYGAEIGKLLSLHLGLVAFQLSIRHPVHSQSCLSTSWYYYSTVQHLEV